ncbi:MAG: SRPBCC family protein [bacterium]|nr:hypothetical protein [Deltaproteobacteria bacterium]MCP4906529.1 SRPBCC family protein [bacterium]
MSRFVPTLVCAAASVPGLLPDFEIEREIFVPRGELQAFLCDLHRYVPLHPFIESIQDLRPTEALPNARRYRVVDRIPIGPFRLKTVYTVALCPVAPDEVHAQAWQSPGIRLRTVYALEKTERGTRLVERCCVAAHPLLRGFVVARARRAHTKTLDEMKELLEDGRVPRF